MAESETQERKGTLKGGHDPSEMAQRSVAARRAKAAARAETAEADARTFRQRLGVSLSKLKQKDLDEVIARLAQAGNANALARLADQAFGTPKAGDTDAPKDVDLAELTRDQRAALMAAIEEPEQADPRGVSVHAHENPSEAGTPPPTPAHDEPLARESPGGTTQSDK